MLQVKRDREAAEAEKRRQEKEEARQSYEQAMRKAAVRVMFSTAALGDATEFRNLMGDPEETIGKAQSALDGNAELAYAKLPKGQTITLPPYHKTPLWTCTIGYPPSPDTQVSLLIFSCCTGILDHTVCITAVLLSYY